MYSLNKITKLKSSVKLIIMLMFTILYTSGLAYAVDETDANDVKAQGYALYNTNHPDAALKILNTLPTNLKDAECYVVLANIYQDKGDINLAIEYLNKAIAINPEYYKAYYNLGCVFLNKKVYGLAEDNLKLAIKYNTEYAYSYYNLGCLYLNTKEYKHAKKNFIKAITFKNDDKDFYINLAYVNKILGKEKEARRILEIYNNAS